MTLLWARYSIPSDPTRPQAAPPFNRRGLPPTVRCVIGVQTGPSSAQRPRRISRKELCRGVHSHTPIPTENQKLCDHGFPCFPPCQRAPRLDGPFFPTLIYYSYVSRLGVHRFRGHLCPGQAAGRELAARKPRPRERGRLYRPTYPPDGGLVGVAWACAVGIIPRRLADRLEGTAGTRGAPEGWFCRPFCGSGSAKAARSGRTRGSKRAALQPPGEPGRSFSPSGGGLATVLRLRGREKNDLLRRMQ